MDNVTILDAMAKARIEAHELRRCATMAGRGPWPLWSNELHKRFTRRMRLYNKLYARVLGDLEAETARADYAEVKLEQAEERAAELENALEQACVECPLNG